MFLGASHTLLKTCTRSWLRAVEVLGGTPFVPFKSNTLEPTEEEEPIWAKMYYYFMYNRLTFMEH